MILTAIGLWIVLPFLFFARVYYVRTHRQERSNIYPLPSGSIGKVERAFRVYDGKGIR